MNETEKKMGFNIMCFFCSTYQIHNDFSVIQTEPNK